MVFDASLGGLGASRLWTEMLTLGLPRSSIDEKAIGIQFGDSASQQIAEALAVLFRVCLAVDLAQKKTSLEVKSDGVVDQDGAQAHTESAKRCGGQGTCVDLILLVRQGQASRGETHARNCQQSRRSSQPAIPTWCAFCCTSSFNWNA